MFDDLKQRQTGFRPKERARLVTSVALLLALGGFLFGGKACVENQNVVKLPTAPAPAPKAPETRPLDMGPLAGLQATPAAPAAFDAAALDHVLREVAGGKVRREPDRVATPAEVVAADPREAVGKTFEVTGTVRSLDKEVFKSAANPAYDQLWAFALEGADGKKVVLVQPGLSSNFEGDKPGVASNAFGAPARLEDGDFIRARGVYVQRRTGGVGALTLDEPVPVLVGREYRLSFPSPDVRESLEAMSWQGVADRSLPETQSVEHEVPRQIVAWARLRGHDAIAADLRSGALPSSPWGRDEFQRFRTELEQDTDFSLPDPRTFTNGARGKVWSTTGIVGDYLKEDWGTIPSNLQGVDARWKLWLLSDFYGNALLLMDSPFPLSAFAGVRSTMELKDARQRVRVYGVFVQTYSYRLSGAARRPDRPGEISVPFFVVLHIEPIPDLQSTPLWENPFFLVWVSLAVFGAAFFFVMSRLERKEAKVLHEQALRIRRGGRASAAAKAAAAAAAGGASREAAGGGSAGTAGGSSGPEAAADAPDAERPPS